MSHTSVMDELALSVDEGQFSAFRKRFRLPESLDTILDRCPELNLSLVKKGDLKGKTVETCAICLGGGTDDLVYRRQPYKLVKEVKYKVSLASVLSIALFAYEQRACVALPSAFSKHTRLFWRSISESLASKQTERVQLENFNPEDRLTITASELEDMREELKNRFSKSVRDVIMRADISYMYNELLQLSSMVPTSRVSRELTVANLVTEDDENSVDLVAAGPSTSDRTAKAPLLATLRQLQMDSNAPSVSSHQLKKAFEPLPPMHTFSTLPQYEKEQQQEAELLIQQYDGNQQAMWKALASSRRDANTTDMLPIIPSPSSNFKRSWHSKMREATTDAEQVDCISKMCKEYSEASKREHYRNIAGRLSSELQLYNYHLTSMVTTEIQGMAAQMAKLSSQVQMSTQSAGRARLITGEDAELQLTMPPPNISSNRGAPSQQREKELKYNLKRRKLLAGLSLIQGCDSTANTSEALPEEDLEYGIIIMRRVLPGSNTSESKVVQLNYSVDPSWIIPMMEVPANHAGTREHKVQWVRWLARTLGMSTFESILSDWDEGLTMKCGAKLAPLRVLEDTKLRDYWRSGPTVNKSVLFYKSLVYMILRLVVGLPRNKSDADEGRRHAPMTVDEAIVHVKQSEYPQQQRVYKKASQVPQCYSMAHLLEVAMKGKEWTPKVFEGMLADESLLHSTPVSLWGTVQWELKSRDEDVVQNDMMDVV